MYKVCAGIVTYEPNINRLQENIHAICSQVELVYVVDNASKNILEIEKLLNDSCNNFKLVKNEINLGIAKALNQIMEKASSDCFEWCITLDQDSVVPVHCVESLLKCVGENVAIVCPEIRDINRTFNGYSDEILSVNKCITSGSLTSVSAWVDVGGFDESMFIDGVDDDFCIKLKKNEYKIIRNSNVVLIHEIGRIEERNFLFWRVIVRNHSAFRKYYISKNIVYLDRKHSHALYPLKTLMRISKQIVLVLFFEDDKFLKCKALIKGTLSEFSEHIKGS